jgi:hypothetical protein
MTKIINNKFHTIAAWRQSETSYRKNLEVHTTPRRLLKQFQQILFVMVSVKGVRGNVQENRKVIHFVVKLQLESLPIPFNKLGTTEKHLVFFFYRCLGYMAKIIGESNITCPNDMNTQGKELFFGKPALRFKKGVNKLIKMRGASQVLPVSVYLRVIVFEYFCLINALSVLVAVCSTRLLALRPRIKNIDKVAYLFNGFSFGIPVRMVAVHRVKVFVVAAIRGMFVQLPEVSSFVFRLIDSRLLVLDPRNPDSFALRRTRLTVAKKVKLLGRILKRKVLAPSFVCTHRALQFNAISTKDSHWIRQNEMGMAKAYHERYGL